MSELARAHELLAQAERHNDEEDPHTRVGSGLAWFVACASCTPSMGIVVLGFQLLVVGEDTKRTLLNRVKMEVGW